jgi:hypothetical protein
MEDIVGFLFAYILTDLIFWGFAYITGCLLTPIVSFGKWTPESLTKDGETGKIIKNQSGFKLIKRSGRTYLGAWSVAFLGCCFWVTVILLAVLL